jgi:hypothetical protein
MRYLFFSVCFLLQPVSSCLCLAQSAAPPEIALTDSAPALASAAKFLALLNAEQKEKVVLPYDSDKRVQWHFIPMATRKGLPVMEMDSGQKAAAMQLLRACLSLQGFQSATEIMDLENLLKILEGNKGVNERNPDKYYFTFFGSPARNHLWGLSIEGHHLSLNFVFDGNQIVDSTPQFFAANPAVVMNDYEGFNQGHEILKPEQRLGFHLIRSLSDSQRQKAILPGDTPGEIYSAGTPQPSLPQPMRGISAAELTENQLEILRKLLRAYTSKMRKQVSDQRMAMIEEAGFEQIQFGWSGGTRAGEGHYYVVQGPTFLIEFINVQPDAAGNPANHIHCVWRDMTGDFHLPYP